MNTNTATIRELRTDFRAVKRKVEQHGEIVITDHGEPAYVLKLLPPPKLAQRRRSIDYYARLLKRQPKAIPAEETRHFWEDERGDR